jgi:hypothetical protein
MMMVLDLPLGTRKVRRAQATVVCYTAGDFATLGKPELTDLVWALSTLLVAAHQGFRLIPDVFPLAESVAYSRDSISECHS